MRRAAQHEYVFPAMLALVIFAVGTLPYLYGYANTPPGMRYMGVTGRGSLHSIGYMMFARQARDGGTLFENKPTSEPLPRGYFHPEWWLYGKVARWTGLSFGGVGHLHRAAAVTLLIFSVYFLAALCLKTRFQRRLAVSIIVFGAGFGWVPWCLSRFLSLPLPPSRDILGVTIFGYLINKPHFMLAAASIVLTYAMLIKGQRTGQRRYYVLSGLFALINLFLRAFAIWELCIIFACYPLLLSLRERRFSWRHFGNHLLAGVMVLPAVAFYAWLLRSGVLGETRLETPLVNFGTYLLWYGPPFVLLSLYCVGPYHLAKLKPSSMLLGLWLAAAFLVAQLHPLIRNGEESSLFAFMMVPGILAVGGPLRQLCHAGLGALTRAGLPVQCARRRRFRIAAATAFVAFCGLSNPVVYARMFTAYHAHPELYYVHEDTLAAMHWLEVHAAPEAVVLSGPVTSPLIPCYAGNKAFTGHDLLTIRRGEKDALANRFFQQRGEDEFKRDLVRDYHVQFVLRGPLEVSPGGMVPGEHPWLRPVFTQGGAAVYAITADTSASNNHP